jgi:hypothetical protein
VVDLIQNKRQAHIKTHRLDLLLYQVEQPVLWPHFGDAIVRLESSANLKYINFHQITPELLKTRIRKLQSLVHGSQRDALQKVMHFNIRQRNELHADVKLGQLIQQILGKSREKVDILTLPSEKEDMIIGHYCIQHKVTNHFKDWHCIPKALDPVADYLATHPLFW